MDIFFSSHPRYMKACCQCSFSFLLFGGRCLAAFQTFLFRPTYANTNRVLLYWQGIPTAWRHRFDQRAKQCCCQASASGQKCRGSGE